MKNSGYYEIGTHSRFLQEAKAMALAGNVLLNRLHWHDHLEIMCCVQGGCTLRIGQETVRLGTGDFTVINCGVPHELYDGVPDGLQIIFSVDASLLRKKADELYSFSTVGEGALARDDADARQFRACVGRLACLMTPDIAQISAAVPTRDQSAGHFEPAWLEQLVLQSEEQWYEFQADLYRALYYLARHKTKTGRRPAVVAPPEPLTRCIELIHSGYAGLLNAATLAEAVALSEPSIYRLFQQKLGVSLNQYIQLVRVNAACALMESTDQTITNIAFACGFTSLSNFYRVFSDLTGVTPRQLQQTAGQLWRHSRLQAGILQLNRFQSFYELPYTKEDLLRF